jgi:hypothetical protein
MAGSGGGMRSRSDLAIARGVDARRRGRGELRARGTQWSRRDASLALVDPLDPGACSRTAHAPGGGPRWSYWHAIARRRLLASLPIAAEPAAEFGR